MNDATRVLYAWYDYNVNTHLKLFFLLPFPPIPLHKMLVQRIAHRDGIPGFLDGLPHDFVDDFAHGLGWPIGEDGIAVR